jgi:hypothetical protein
MDPQAAHLLRSSPGIHLAIEEICHRMVVEEDRDAAADLADKQNIFDVKRIVGRRNSKPADLGFAQVTQAQEFRPGNGAQPK